MSDATLLVTQYLASNMQICWLRQWQNHAFSLKANKFLPDWKAVALRGWVHQKTISCRLRLTLFSLTWSSFRVCQLPDVSSVSWNHLHQWVRTNENGIQSPSKTEPRTQQESTSARLDEILWYHLFCKHCRYGLRMCLHVSRLYASSEAWKNKLSAFKAWPMEGQPIFHLESYSKKGSILCELFKKNQVQFFAYCWRKRRVNSLRVIEEKGGSILCVFSWNN